MKINTKYVNQMYQSQVNVKTSKVSSKSKENVDKIEVSNFHNNQVKNLANKAVNDLNQTYSNSRLNEIKNQVQNGTYKVNHEKVADALIKYSDLLKGE